MTQTASNTTTPWSTRLGLSALLMASALAWAGASQAQSAYTLSTLKTSLLQRALRSDADFFIDTQNRVYSSSDYYQGFSFNTGGLLVLTVPVYKPFIVQWAVPLIGNSVEPTKVSTRQFSLDGVSPDGGKFIVKTYLGDQGGIGVLDRAAQAGGPSSVGSMPGAAYAPGVVAVNSAGRQALNDQVPVQDSDVTQAGAHLRALSWAPGQTPLALLAGPQFLGASTSAISEAGVVVGAVYGFESAMDTHAARWVNGVLEVLDNRAGLGSRALDVNDAGQVLIRAWEPKLHHSESPYYHYVEQTKPTYGVIQNGALVPIVSNQAGYSVFEVKGINASGTVIGTLAPLNATPDSTGFGTGTVNRTRRAFIWKNGTMTDLTALAAAKGVKLPAGVVLNRALDINDQGSLVAGYLPPKGDAPVYVRLLAKP